MRRAVVFLKPCLRVAGSITLLSKSPVVRRTVDVELEIQARDKRKAYLLIMISATPFVFRVAS